MFKANRPNLSFLFSVSALCLTLMGLCCLAAAQTQHASAKAPALKYDVKAEKKIKGVVQEMKLEGQGRGALMHLTLKTATDTVNVYLCPETFIKDMGIELKSGDEVEIIGSPVLDKGLSVILAREIDKGSDAYVLRDEKGVPVWNWQHT